MPFYDIIFDYSWVKDGQFKDLQPIDGGSINLQFNEESIQLDLHLYCSGINLLCVRLLNKEIILSKFHDLFVNFNEYLRLSTENAATLITGRPHSALMLPGTNQYFTISGEDEPIGNSVEIYFNVKDKIPNWSDWAMVINSISQNNYKYSYYLSRVINNIYPMEMRWLGAYKIIEEHFGGQIAKDHGWRTMCQKYKNEFIPFLDSPGQSVHGIIESLRNICAHAVCEYKVKNEAIEKTFPIMCRMSCEILNLKRPNGSKFNWVS